MISRVTNRCFFSKLNVLYSENESRESFRLTYHVSSDLGIARVYLSIFPSERSKELYDAICANTKAIRFELGKRVHLQLRKIPELSFFIDDSLDYIDHIDTLLK